MTCIHCGGWTCSRCAPAPGARPTLSAVIGRQRILERLKVYHKDCLAPLQQTALLEQVDRLQSENIGLRVQLVEANAALVVRQLSGAA